MIASSTFYSMTEQDILKIIENDKWMMDILHVAEKVELLANAGKKSGRN